jgi:hypothetical protein
MPHLSEGILTIIMVQSGGFARVLKNRFILITFIKIILAMNTTHVHLLLNHVSILGALFSVAVFA